LYNNYSKLISILNFILKKGFQKEIFIQNQYYFVSDSFNWSILIILFIIAPYYKILNENSWFCLEPINVEPLTTYDISYFS